MYGSCFKLIVTIRSSISFDNVWIVVRVMVFSLKVFASYVSRLCSGLLLCFVDKGSTVD